MTNDELYAAAIEADRAFTAGLVAHYGKGNAGDARYLPSPEMPTHIVALKLAKVAADDAYLSLFNLGTGGSCAPWTVDAAVVA